MAVSTRADVTLSLLDPTTNETYNIIVSADDAEQAGQDLTFATQLFAQAKLQAAVAANRANRQTPIVRQTLPQAIGTTKQLTTPAIPCCSSDIAVTGSPAPELQFSDQTVDNCDDKEDGNCTWTKPMVLLLIRLYKELESNFISGKMSQKQAWERLSKRMLEHGYEVPSNKCASKLSSLKRTYKTVKDHNNKSGNDRRAWYFLDVMDELFSDKPWIKPASTASSDGNGHSESDSAIDSQPSQPCTLPRRSTSKRKLRKEDLMERLLEEKKLCREAKERQHAEKICEAKRLSDILEKLVAAKSTCCGGVSAEDDISD